ncbi:MAG: hypothetical protein ABIN67_01280 [Ferruginibacter sp.]
MRCSLFLLLLLISLRNNGQNIPSTSVEPDSAAIDDINRNSTIWQGRSPLLTLEKIAAYAAPVIWFSPDEPNMKGYIKRGIHIPEAFPFEKNTGKPVVYYKLLNVFTSTPEEQNLAYINNNNKGLSEVNLEVVKAFYLDYYFYYSSEMGLGSHPHDLESVVMKIVVDQNPDNRTFRLRVENVNGRAHGLYWYNNLHVVDTYTKFPITVLIEEGKHASCPDANGDGVYTPSYDVNVRTNDAWGIRDIIRGGTLFTGAFQSWMVKARTPATIISPPLPPDSPIYNDFANDTRKLTEKASYELRPFPETDYITKDKHLRELIQDKKPIKWPAIKHSRLAAKKIKGIPEDQSRHSVTLAYRYDSGGNLILITPLLLFKNVAAPMTGGWFVNKFYSGQGDYVKGLEPIRGIVSIYDRTIFGHMVMHMSSASRWIEPYVGVGYEINDYDDRRGIKNYKVDFASEYGVKIRFSIRLKPFYKKRRFIGIRFGYKVTGFSPIKENGMLFEIGAGAW